MLVLLFAFGFATPLMLGGLLLSGIPVLIHLLHRRRFREEQWAAMRFLLRATEKHARRMRLEQWLLLALRTLILACVILALAEPGWKSAAAPRSGDLPVLKVIILDESASLGAVNSGTQQFQKVRDLARKVVQTAGSGDAFLLGTLSNASPRWLIGRPSRQPASVLEEIEQLGVTDGRADLAESLAEIERTISSLTDFPHKELILISDLQESTWWPVESLEQMRLKQKWQHLADLAKLTVLDVGPMSSQNVGVVRLESREPFALTGQFTTLNATLYNFSTAALDDQPVELHLDGRLVDTRRVSIPARQETVVEFRPLLSSAGSHRLEVKVRPDGFDLDNSRRLVLPTREELQVLLVNGKPSAKPMGAATDYLRLALSPGKGDQPSPSRIRSTICNELEFAAKDLTKFDVVFLCNVATISERDAEALRKYMQGGGGVVFCCGDQVQPESYNRWLMASGKELLPARLGERQGDPVKRETAFDFDPGDYQHPIVRPFQGNSGSGLELTKTFAYIQCVPRTETRVRIPLKFNTGDPAILECDVGRGRSILVTTSVDREWSTWAVWGHSLIPLMHETVRYAQSGKWSDRRLMVGQPLSVAAPNFAANDVPLHWKTPWGEQPGRWNEADREVVGETAWQSGFCEIRFGPPVNHSEWIAVEFDRRESEPASLTAEDLRDWGAQARILNDWSPASTTGTSETAPATNSSLAGESLFSFSRWLLIAAFAFWLAETVLAWNFDLGVAVLIAVAVWSPLAFVMPPIYAAALLAILPGLLIVLRTRTLSR